MWNRSSKIQHNARMAVGSAALAAAIILPLSGSSALNPVVMAGRAGEAASLLFSSYDHGVPILTGPYDTEQLEGTAIFMREPDGQGVIVGRVEFTDGQYMAVLAPDHVQRYASGAVLLYAPPVRRLDEALDILLAPDGLEAEMRRAREALWPVIEHDLIQPTRELLGEEFKKLLAELPASEGDRLSQIATELFAELSGESEELVSRLVARSWKEIGVWGLAEGVARKVSQMAENGYKDVKSAIRGLFGPKEDGTPTQLDFLTEERKQALRAAIRDELNVFWNDRGAQVLEKSGRVLSRHQEHFLQRIKDEWLPRLYEQTVLKVWNERRDVLVAAVSDYAADLARRRLLTDEDAPQLTLAYAVRSAASVTKHPLLVVQEAPDATPGQWALKPYRTGLVLAPQKLTAVNPGGGN